MDRNSKPGGTWTHTESLQSGRECLDAALYYHTLGWAPLALCPPDHVGVGRQHGATCTSPGKRPWHTWTEYQTRLPTEEEIREWWRQQPYSGLGVALGTVSGLIGVDADGDEGEEELVSLSGGDLPPTLEFRTGNGRRLLYGIPPGVAVRSTHQETGQRRALSLLATGSQTVMPPSRHVSGRRYRWVDERGPGEIQVALAPSWLIGALRPEASSSRRRRQSEQTSGQPIYEKTRNTTLASLAGSMRRRGMTTDEIHVALTEVNERRCKPPLPENEVRQIAESIGKYLPAQDENRGAGSGVVWGDVIPLNEAPPVPEFPVSIFPERLQRLVREMAEAFNCPPDYPGVTILGLSGGCLGASREISLTRSHLQSARIFAALVGPPASAKSPQLKMLRHPIDTVANEYLRSYKAALEEWQNKEPDDRGPRPKLRRCIVADITTESLAVILEETPRGVVMVRDELTGLFSGLNQYKAGGKGNDRQAYLQLWSGDPLVIDRKSDKERGGVPLCVSHPYCAIVGGIQPGVLDSLRQRAGRDQCVVDDGLTDRFLFSWPALKPSRGETWQEVSQEACDAWDHTVRWFLGLGMVHEQNSGTERPFFLKLSSEAKREWESFTNAHAQEMNAEEFPANLRGPWEKLRAYCARLALIIHELRVAAQEVEENPVDGESLRRAGLAIKYFKGHARRVHNALGSDPRLEQAMKIKDWIKAQGVPTFQKRDAYQACKGTIKEVRDLDAVLLILERHQYIRALETQRRPGPGQQPSPFYEVNPAILQTTPQDSQNSQN